MTSTTQPPPRSSSLVVIHQQHRLVLLIIQLLLSAAAASVASDDNCNLFMTTSSSSSMGDSSSSSSSWMIQMSQAPGNTAFSSPFYDDQGAMVSIQSIAYDEVGDKFFGMSGSKLVSFTATDMIVDLGAIDGSYEVAALTVKYEGSTTSHLFGIARLLSSGVWYLVQLDKTNGAILNSYQTNLSPNMDIVDMAWALHTNSFVTDGTQVVRLTLRRGVVRTRSVGNAPSTTLTGIAIKPDGTVYGIDNQVPPNFFDLIIDQKAATITIGTSATAAGAAGAIVPAVTGGATFQC